MARIRSVGFGNTFGTSGDDDITGSPLSDTIFAGAGNDTINAGYGNDLIFGGLGNDTIDGGFGFDTVSYSDREYRSQVAVDLWINLDYGYAEVRHSSERDRLISIENVIGSQGNDDITGNVRANVISGGRGDDIIEGGAGDDTLDGGVNLDTVAYLGATRSVSVDLMYETADAGSYGVDVIRNFENVAGSDHDDVIKGDAFWNVLKGRDGDDRLDGRAGNDSLEGGYGNDTLIGGDGNDTLDGGVGNDGLYGGLGADSFVFEPFKFLPHDTNEDIIVDFQPGSDRIVFDVTDISSPSHNLSVLDITQVGRDTVISHAFDDFQLTLHNVDMDDLNLTRDIVWI